MEVYPNHTFQPDAVVRRADLARAVSRVLELVAQRNPQLAAALAGVAAQVSGPRPRRT